MFDVLKITFPAVAAVALLAWLTGPWIIVAAIAVPAMLAVLAMVFRAR